MLVTEATGGQVMEDAITADGFEKALLGFGHQFNFGLNSGTRTTTPVAVYSKDRCLHVLMERDGMSREDALEFFDFNVAGAWVGEGMPVFLE